MFQLVIAANVNVVSKYCSFKISSYPKNIAFLLTRASVIAEDILCHTCHTCVIILINLKANLKLNKRLDLFIFLCFKTFFSAFVILIFFT